MENLELKFMKEAIKQSKIAFKNNEVPIGCVIVQNNKIIAKAYNKCEKNNDPTAHAEILAIKKACRSPIFSKNAYTKMYVTLEPCLMCVGAILHANINEVIFALPNSENGFLYTHKCDLILNGSNSEKHFSSHLGYCGEESKNLLDLFFKECRK